MPPRVHIECSHSNAMLNSSYMCFRMPFELLVFRVTHFSVRARNAPSAITKVTRPRRMGPTIVLQQYHYILRTYLCSVQYIHANVHTLFVCEFVYQERRCMK